MIEILSCDFDESESQIFQNGSIYPQTLLATFLNCMNQRQEDITSHI